MKRGIPLRPASPREKRGVRPHGDVRGQRPSGRHRHSDTSSSFRGQLDVTSLGGCARTQNLPVRKSSLLVLLIPRMFSLFSFTVRGSTEEESRRRLEYPLRSGLEETASDAGGKKAMSGLRPLKTESALEKSSAVRRTSRRKAPCRLWSKFWGGY